MPPEPPWLADAARMPVAFAVVREDPLLDLEVLKLCPKEARVLMVASGGCTAALLAAQPNVHHIHLVDPNPAQLALARLKLHLLQTQDPARRAAILGHAPMEREERRQLIEPCTSDSLGPMSVVSTLGPDHVGRYELLFQRLREMLRPRYPELDALLHQSDPVEQSACIRPGTPLGDALDAAYDDVLALPNLVRLFGEGATQNPVEPFSRHFARRTRAVLATLPARSNPYLWLMLRGQLPPGTTLPWLDLPRQHQLASVSFTQGFMADVLGGSDCYHFIHLSNILDWLKPEEATHTLDLAFASLVRGGRVLIRQLNSTLDIPALGQCFHWEPTTEMLARDRSFFYRALHLGRKP